MENNKILISIHFDSDWYENGKKIDGKTRVIELMILRDASLRQLLESVYYGLKKQIKIEKKVSAQDDSVLSYEECFDIYDNCINSKEALKEQYWPNIRVSLYDRKTLEKKPKDHTIIIEDGKEHVVLLKSDLDEKLCDLGFISATRLVFFKDKKVGNDIHEINTGNIIVPFNPENEESEIKFPKYNISTRQLQCYDRTPIEIIPPSNPPQEPKQNLWMMLLPTVMTIAVMVLLRSALTGANGGSGALVLMSVAMGVVTLLTTIMTWSKQKKNYKKSLKEWKRNYEGYIERVIARIKSRQANDAKILCNAYPSSMTLFKKVLELNDDVFSRSPSHSDFLTVRLGLSDQIESLFEIKGKEKEEIFSPATFELSEDSVSLSLVEDGEVSNNDNPDYYLSNLPSKIAETYRCMKGAPCLYSLSKCGALGIVYDDKSGQISDIDSVMELFIRRMMFELCYYHSPENLQFVIFFPETTNQAKINEYINRYAHLPHCRDLFANKSQFVFSKKSANIVLSSMLKIMEERNRSGNEAEKTPHIVFIVLEEYNLKEHAFASYLPSAPKEGVAYQNKLGLTFVFAKRYKEHLPEYCSDIITLTNQPNGECSITPYNNKEQKKIFRCDTISKAKDDGAEKRSFRMLSGIYYTRISQNRQVPSSVSLFQQFGITCDGEESIGKRISDSLISNWGYDEENRRIFDVTKTLAVPIGMTDNDKAVLDLHERADGPHMLVAGTTGSGKSETIISYLIGLCMRFRPDEVNMMLVDMKGGGFTKRLGTLPHVVGKVTDIDGDENNTGAEYMLKRFLVAIKSEVKRRKLVINHFQNVDSIDGYIKKCRELKAVADASKEDLKYIKDNPLTHLILVVDEFTELKRFSNENSEIDYMGELTTIARIGRSLGIHIILISQNIEGAITDDIRVNSKSRLCLKVATRQASKEMIGNELAAAPSMPGNGRAYLLVGTGSKFEYFQSAYSGVLASENNSSDLTVTNVEKEGEYTQFYCSYEDNEEIIGKRKGQKDTQLKVTVEAVRALYETMKEKGTIEPVREIFRDPLPTRAVLREGKAFDLNQKKYI